MENKPQKDNSRTILALLLIAVGVIWMLRKIGLYINFPEIPWNYVFSPIRPIFHSIGDFIFSWQVILIIVGLILMAGRRSTGIVLVVIGGIFLIPKIFFMPHITISFLLPVVLIGLGVVLVARHISSES